jgi:hypothetical protein
VAQLNRDGYNKENPTMENVGSSIGIVQCSDFCGFLFATDDMKSINQIGLSIGKSRFGAVNRTKRYSVNDRTLEITETHIDDEVSPIDLEDDLECESLSPDDYFNKMIGDWDG